MDSKIRAGHTLSEDNINRLSAGFRQREAFIEAYKELEERLDRERNALASYLAELSKAVRLPAVGNVLQVQRLSGNVWHDAWTGAEFSFEMEGVEDLSPIEIEGIVARDPAFEGVSSLSLSISGGRLLQEDVTGTDFSIGRPIHLKAGERFSYSLTSSSTFNPANSGVGSDQRDLAMMSV